MLCKHWFSTVHVIYRVFFYFIFCYCLFVDVECEKFSYSELCCFWLAGNIFKQLEDVSQKFTFYTIWRKI